MRPRTRWRFITNHALVLICIARNPGLRLKDIADRVGITERSAQTIVHDLAAAHYVEAHREGRRRTYELHPDLPLRHPLLKGHRIGDILEALAEDDGLDLESGVRSHPDPG